MIQRCQTNSKRRFYNNVRTINWKDKGIKVYLRVSYGKRLSCYGKMENFWNDGVYDNEKDLELSLDAFTEE